MRIIYDYSKYTTKEINILYNALAQYETEDKNEVEIAKLMRKDLYAELLKRRQKA
jgi:DNA polymerase III delta prime subunit